MHGFKGSVNRRFLTSILRLFEVSPAVSLVHRTFLLKPGVVPIKSNFMKKLLVLSLFVLTATTLSAQSKVKGLGLSLDLNSTTLTVDDADKTELVATGFGGALTYGFSDDLAFMFKVDMSVGEAKDETDRVIGSADLGLMYFFGTSEKKMRPYLSAGFHGTSISTVDEPVIQVSYGGTAFGAGLYYFFSRKMALHAGLSYSDVKHTETTVDGEKIEESNVPNVTNVRLVGGLRISF